MIDHDCSRKGGENRYGTAPTQMKIRVQGLPLVPIVGVQTLAGVENHHERR